MRILLSLILVAMAFNGALAEDGRKSVQISTPEGSCASLEKVEEESVYLVSKTGRCKSVKMPVMIGKDIFKARIYLDGKFWMEQGLVAVALPDMDRVKGDATRLQENIQLPDLEKNKEAVAAAKKTADYINSPEYQARVAAEADRIRNEVYAKETDVVKRYYPDGKDGKKGGPSLKPDERVYVFISSSMPVETLRNYITSMEKAGEPGMVMVMKGMVGGVSKIRPTMDFIASFLIKDKDCLKRSLSGGGTEECESYATEVLIDPYLFRRYDIFKVPAVVYAAGVRPENIEMSEGDEENTPQAGLHATVYGDAALDAVLETIADSKKSKTLEAVVKKMRAGYY